MELPRFELSEWIDKYVVTVRHNFGESGIEPPDLAEAGIDLNAEEFYRRYPRGRVGLEEALAEIFGVEPENVLVTSSGSEAIYLVHHTLLQRGDEVIVPVPNYPAQLKVPEVVGAKVTPVRLRFEEEWRLDLEQVKGLLTPKTRLISITNSHNPTGAQLSKRALEGLLELAEDAKAWLLCDEAFREFGFEKAPPPAASLGERAISLGTMSKFYGVDDIRIGWALAAKEVVRQLKQLKTWITAVNSRFGEYVAKQVMENHKWFVERARKFKKENLDLVRGFMARSQHLQWVEPAGSLFCFPRITTGGSSLEFCRRLAEEHSILVDPGITFETEGYVRLCFTRRPKKVKGGLEALQLALNSLERS